MKSGAGFFSRLTWCRHRAKVASRLMRQPAVTENRRRLMLSRPESGAPFHPRSHTPARPHGGACSASTAVLALAGEIDLANCGYIPVDVERLCRQGCHRVKLDLGAVSFIDAAGVSAILEARRRAQECGCELVLGAVRGVALRVLRLLDLDSAFVIEGDESHE
jgi:anti-anti-sigma factor